MISFDVTYLTFIQPSFRSFFGRSATRWDENVSQKMKRKKSKKKKFFFLYFFLCMCECVCNALLTKVTMIEQSKVNVPSLLAHSTWAGYLSRLRKWVDDDHVEEGYLLTYAHHAAPYIRSYTFFIRIIRVEGIAFLRRFSHFYVRTYDQKFATEVITVEHSYCVQQRINWMAGKIFSLFFASGVSRSTFYILSRFDSDEEKNNLEYEIGREKK